MAKEFVDKTRTGIPGGGSKLAGVLNQSAWGEKAAVDRGYCQGTRTFPPPEQANKPQRAGEPNNLQDKGYDNDVPENSWLRGGGESAEGKPNYVGGYRAPRGEPGDRGGPPLRPGAKGPHR